MAEIRLNSEETKEVVNYPFHQVIGGIGEYMDKTNTDEGEMKLETDKFTFTLSVKRKKGS